MLTVALLAMLLQAPSDADLDAAEAAYKSADFDAVMPRLKLALARRLPRALRVRAHALEARTEITFERDRAAIAAFRKVLWLDPQWLPEGVPAVLNAFSEARRLGPISTPEELLEPEPKPSAAPPAAVAPVMSEPAPPQPMSAAAKAVIIISAVAVAGAGLGFGIWGYIDSRPHVPAGTLPLREF